LAPANPLAEANLGVALREAGDLEAAEAACRRAIELNADFAVGHNSLGNVLKAKGDLEGAKAAFAAALERRPGYQDARLNRAAAMFQAGDGDGAEAEYEAALERNPDLAEAHAGLGVVLLAAGRLEDAVERFKKAVAANPALGDAQYNLATAAGAEIGEDETAEIGRLAQAEYVPAAERVKLRFALAEIADAKGDPAAAFAEMEAGNAARKALLEKAGKGFDAAAHDALVERIIAAFGPDWFAGRKDRGEVTDQPVFIVGMPRSGTTLVEQIAASHPAVLGRGETDAVRILAGDDPAAAAAMDGNALDALAADVLTRLRAGAGSADGTERIADKTPFNFFHLGLIQALFPNARVVHCVRDPLDVGLSCFRQNFTAPHAWACALDHIGRYVRAHDRLMEHWRGVLSMPMLEIRYEDLIEDQERESRRLVDFLGLEWDPACLDFHQSGRAVLTASNWQVRKPLYASAVGRAEPYATFLGPLKKALGG
ncbi:MAG: sulfotransferase, partial [Rhodospirillales bacterium]